MQATSTRSTSRLTTLCTTTPWSGMKAHCLHLLKSSIESSRVGYFRRLLDQMLKFDYRGAAALDVAVAAAFLLRNLLRWAFM